MVSACILPEDHELPVVHQRHQHRGIQSGQLLPWVPAGLQVLVHPVENNRKDVPGLTMPSVYSGQKLSDLIVGISLGMIKIYFAETGCLGKFECYRSCWPLGKNARNLASDFDRSVP